MSSAHRPPATILSMLATIAAHERPAPQQSGTGPVTNVDYERTATAAS